MKPHIVGAGLAAVLTAAVPAATQPLPRPPHRAGSLQKQPKTSLPHAKTSNQPAGGHQTLKPSKKHWIAQSPEYLAWSTNPGESPKWSAPQAAWLREQRWESAEL